MELIIGRYLVRVIGRPRGGARETVKIRDGGFFFFFNAACPIGTARGERVFSHLATQ